MQAEQQMCGGVCVCVWGGGGGGTYALDLKKS